MTSRLKLTTAGSSTSNLRNKCPKIINCATLDRYQPEQFRKAFHSYEERFIMCVKQYKRHLPPLGDGTKSDLFLGCINNPIDNVWFIRSSKVGKETAHKWLKNALELVGIPGDKSGRATLITRLAASGVPDEVGRLISGHHTLSGYSRYDRTQSLKMEAAQLCSFNPRMDYGVALSKVSEKFKEEQLVGSSLKLNPLVDTSERHHQLQIALWSELHMSEVGNQKPLPSNLTAEKEKNEARILQDTHEGQPVVTLKDLPSRLAEWHSSYDSIDWEEAIVKDPVVARALGGRFCPALNNLGGNTFSNLANSTIQICVGQVPICGQDDNKDNISQ